MKTRDARGALTALRLHDYNAISPAAGLQPPATDKPQRFFTFDLPLYAPGHGTTMSWLLSDQSRQAMDVMFSPPCVCENADGGPGLCRVAQDQAKAVRAQVEPLLTALNEIQPAPTSCAKPPQQAQFVPQHGPPASRTTFRRSPEAATGPTPVWQVSIPNAASGQWDLRSRPVSPPYRRL